MTAAGWHKVSQQEAAEMRAEVPCEAADVADRYATRATDRLIQLAHRNVAAELRCMAEDEAS